jgi:TPR repeat protein
MRQTVFALFILLIIQCITVRAEYGDADKAYEMGDHALAFSRYKLLAERGDVSAQVNIGWMYYYGEGVSQDKSLALVWYRKAAEQGDVSSMFNLAYGYDHGDGVRRDLNESRRWYAKAAEQRNMHERLNFKRLTKTFLTPDVSNTGVTGVFNEKIILSTKSGEESKIAAAAAAIAEPARLTAAMREEERKSDLAASQWRKLYNRNSIDMVKLPTTEVLSTAAKIPIRMAKMTKDGNTLSLSENTAIEIFPDPRLEGIRLAAEDGDINAQVTLGWIYSSGIEIPANKAKAAKWYQLAAEKGNLNAQVALGWMYYDGQGGERNLEKSAFWYDKAAAQGSIKAKQMLKKIKLLRR